MPFSSETPIWPWTLSKNPTPVIRAAVGDTRVLKVGSMASSPSSGVSNSGISAAIERGDHHVAIHGAARLADVRSRAVFRRSGKLGVCRQNHLVGRGGRCQAAQRPQECLRAPAVEFAFLPFGNQRQHARLMYHLLLLDDLGLEMRMLVCGIV